VKSRLRAANLDIAESQPVAATDVEHSEPTRVTRPNRGALEQRLSRVATPTIATAETQPAEKRKDDLVRQSLHVAVHRRQTRPARAGGPTTMNHLGTVHVNCLVPTRRTAKAALSSLRHVS
jgi:hypothetical protein